MMDAKEDGNILLRQDDGGIRGEKEGGHLQEGRCMFN